LQFSVSLGLTDKPR